MSNHKETPMKNFSNGLTILALASLTAGCAELHNGSYIETMSGIGSPQYSTQMRFLSAETDRITTTSAAPHPPTQERMRVRHAYLSVDVRAIADAVASAVSATEQAGGYVEERSESERSAKLRLRVPSDKLDAAMSGLETLGDVTHQQVSTDDVTEQYADIEARHKNRVVLRDRMRELLAKATDVKDILAIENELNRVQSDIDAMEARMRSLKGQADYASIRLTLTRKPVPGPLGLLCNGAIWCVKKLFIIRD